MGTTDLKRGEDSVNGIVKILDSIISDLGDAYDQIDKHYDIKGFTGKSKEVFLQEFYDEARYVDKVHEIHELKEPMPNQYGHCLRVALETKLFVDDAIKHDDFSIDDEQKSALYTAAMIHDYKKKDCNHEAINRKGPLSPREIAEMRTHTHARDDIEKYVLNGDGLNQVMLEMVIDIVQGHHPAYGTKLENGFGQVLIIADCLDSMKIRGQYQPDQPDSYVSNFFNMFVEKGILERKYVNPIIRMVTEYSREERTERNNQDYTTHVM
ncbi:MAG: hypothetical protein KKE20_04240 [Nanoarchaeota archaeon]|nr:hypothetical protein [Nanoarchaeota archaeon]